MKWPWVLRSTFEFAKNSYYKIYAEEIRRGDYWQKDSAREIERRIEAEKKLMALDDLVDFWRDEAKRQGERGHVFEQLAEKQKGVIDREKENARYWQCRYTKEHKDFLDYLGQTETREEAQAHGFGIDTGEIIGGVVLTTPVPEMRPLRESRITVLNTLDTGRLDGKTSDRGAAPDRK